MDTPKNARDEGLQFFKEEKVLGATYDVYLKKVRYHTASDELGGVVPVPSGAGDRISSPQSTFYCNVDDDKKATLQWRLEEIRVIRSGTLEKLVEALSNDTGELDSSYVDTFLATYRTFSTAKDVLRLLLDRYKTLTEDMKMKQHLKEGHLRCIRMLLLGWLDTFPEDFLDPPSYSCLQMIKDFTLSHLTDSSLAERLRKKISQIKRKNDHKLARSVEDITLEFGFGMQSSTHCISRSNDNTYNDLLSIPSHDFAQQLTYLDAELFKKVIPYQCLGSCWSRRNNKKSASNVGSVFATVNQFNTVSYRVIATVLKNCHEMSLVDRARVIEKWIDIAQELRIIKNFSSLKAIISALQSTSVFRLTRAWALVPKPKLQAFLELAEIFSEQNNQQMVREVLYREGTAKFADPETVNTVRGRRSSAGWGLKMTSPRRISMFETANASIIQGTVPYLGIFLTDLTMVDSAFPDVTDSGLINFEKHRKEFEILTQIKLLQSSAALYRIAADPAFYRYLMSLRVYDDNESYELSCEIQPDQSSAVVESSSHGHKRRSSLGFFTVRRPSSIFYSDEGGGGGSLSLLKAPDPDGHSLHSLPGAILTKTKKTKTRPSLRTSASLGSIFDDPALQKPPKPASPLVTSGRPKSTETLLAKIFYQGSGSNNTNQYKGVLLTNMDRTHTVIKAALVKYGLTGNAEDYCLYQRLSNDKEQLVPENTNVFYAVDSRCNQICFTLRRKTECDQSPARARKKR